MTITKHYQTTFSNTALGQTMATKLAESYAENGWDVDIKSTTNCIVVCAFWAGGFDEGSEQDGNNK